MSPGEYRKLPGDFRGFFRRNTLWLGPDHLLLVDSSRFSETYKRFYLPDIQTIIIRKTPRFVLPYYWVLLAIAALLLLFLSTETALRSIAVRWIGPVILVAEAIYLYFTAMFESCACHLVTRVNKVELPSLFRLRSARMFADEIAPRITAIQGSLPEGWIERATTLQELSTAADRNPDELLDVLPTGAFSWLTVAVFVFVLIDAGLTVLQLRGASSSTFLPNIVNMIALAVCGTIALVQLTRRKTGRALRSLVLAGLLCVAGATYGATIIESIDQQVYHRTFDKILDYPGMWYLGAGEIVVDLAIAASGLLLAFRQSRRPQRSTSLFDAGGPPA